MKCFNSQIGEIDYAEQHVFTFADGIIGFEHLRKFVIISDEETEPFRWLISVEDEDVCLPILDPNCIIANYDVLNCFPEGTTVAVIASLKEPVQESTVNVRSPILFDAEQKKGKQIILPDEQFAVQHKFVAERQLIES